MVYYKTEVDNDAPELGPHITRARSYVSMVVDPRAFPHEEHDRIREYERDLSNYDAFGDLVLCDEPFDD